MCLSIDRVKACSVRAARTSLSNRPYGLPSYQSAVWIRRIIGSFWWLQFETSSVASCQHRPGSRALPVLESVGKAVEIDIGHAECTSLVLPARNGVVDMRQYLLRA